MPGRLGEPGKDMGLEPSRWVMSHHGSAATSVVEERQVDNRVDDHSSDCVDR